MSVYIHNLKATSSQPIGLFFNGIDLKHTFDNFENHKTDKKEKDLKEVN